ncbi:PREDICTED: B3 domain-containing protein At4g02870 [Tarenaya hassleriana]|uniref:B3 domain-containing protein At4g02870 n=1 Tax=Tarenaya hassleriana TaxID=28532 RepID=UPI00053C7A7B|nr:PREDICTED: B3 domain-containing protein At4g02870 [Tarenaya hassleriana]
MEKRGGWAPLKKIRVEEEEDSSPWKIKKTLTREELSTKGQCVRLQDSDVKNFILNNWSEMIVKRAEIDDIRITVDDLDTGSEHESSFRYYKPHPKHKGGYFLQGLWKYNFVERRSLSAGDEIGLFCDPRTKKLCFSVLKRAKTEQDSNLLNT